MAMSPRLLRPLASGFNPRQIAGLAAWWDSTDSSTITTDTGVSAWVDKSGNGYTLEQSTGANQPTLSAINGTQAFEYDGSNQFLLSTDAGLIAEANASSSFNDTTIFLVGESDTTDAARFSVMWGNSTNNNAVYCAIHFHVDGVWRTFYRPISGGAIVSTESTLTYAANVPYVVVTQTGSDIVGRANGFEVIDTPNTFTGEEMGADQFAVGALARSSVVAYMDGRIGDVLIYNRVLTLAEVQRVERWLAGKFGVTLS